MILKAKLKNSGKTLAVDLATVVALTDISNGGDTKGVKLHMPSGTSFDVELPFQHVLYLWEREVAPAQNETADQTASNGESNS